MNPLSNLAPAIKDLASTQQSSFATTQAVWRFLNNDRISFKQLNQPITQLALEQIPVSKHHYALVVHDWSQLQYVKHSNKINRLKRTHKHDLGYELQSSLLVDAERGLPIAPIAQTLSDATGRYTTFTQNDALETKTHLDSLMQQIDHIETLALDKQLVHVIDREGESVAHLREFHRKGYQWLIRCKEGNLIDYQDQLMKVKDVANVIVLNHIKPVSYKGKEVDLYVGEEVVQITRAAKPKAKDAQGKRVKPQAGETLTVRLIVAEVREQDSDKALSRWTLLSNVEQMIQATELATWYYWRWSIESYFKLLKQAGHDIESWLQTSPQAILRRLLIASMACVLTWRIQRANDEQSIQVRQFLTRLSGRVQKRGKRESAPAILAGLSILLNTITLLSEYSAVELQQIAQQALGYLHDV